MNPAKGVESLPRKVARRHVYLTAGDVHRLAGEAEEHRGLVFLTCSVNVGQGDTVGGQLVECVGQLVECGVDVGRCR